MTASYHAQKATRENRLGLHYSRFQPPPCSSHHCSQRSRNTVKRYAAAEGWAGYRAPDRPGALAGLETWLAERFRRHRGNAGVVRQDLAREHGLKRKPADG